MVGMVWDGGGTSSKNWDCKQNFRITVHMQCLAMYLVFLL